MRPKRGLLLLINCCLGLLLFVQLQLLSLAHEEADPSWQGWKGNLWSRLLDEFSPANGALQDLARRLASMPDQQKATLLYLELTSGGLASTSQLENCHVRTSLAELSSPDNNQLPISSSDSPLETARRRVQMDELPEGTMSGGSLNDAQAGPWLSLAQRLALDNANLLTRLGLHAPSLGNGFVADEHFSKYLLELGLLNQRLVPSRLRGVEAHLSSHPIHSVGLIFCKPRALEENKQEPEVEFGWLAEPASPQARLIDLREGLLKNSTTNITYSSLTLPFYAKWALASEELQVLARDLSTDRSLEQEDGRWFSPYRDCGLSNRWLLTYSVPLFGRSNGRPVFRGVSFASLDFARLNMLNQCGPQHTQGLASGTEEEAGPNELVAASRPEEADVARSLMLGSNQCWRLRGSKCLRLEGPVEGPTLRLGHYVCLCALGHQVMAREPVEETRGARARLQIEALVWARNASIPLPIEQLTQHHAAAELLSGVQLASSQPAAIHHFQLGQQLEAEAALTWLLAWPEAKWPALSCRACLNTTTGNNDSTQACHEPPFYATTQLNDATSASWHPIRPLVAGLQAAGSLLMLALLGLLMRIRKSRVIIASGRLMLTTTLVGALFLYSSVLVRCLKTSSLGCLLEAWLREIGFSIFYGSLLIKLYRIYTEFQTRKAHRVCLRDKDQMAYLMAIVFIVISYMSSWTALVLDGFLYRAAASKLGPPKTRGPSGASLEQLLAGLVEQQHHWDASRHIFASSYGLRCRKLNWDYVTEFNEMGLLLFGIYLIYKLRNASSKSHKEKLVLSMAFFLELLVSGATYAARHALWDRLTPDQLLLLYCARCQLTLTPTLALVFGPKLWTICRSRQSLLFGALKTTGGATGGGANQASLRHRCHITCELHDHHLNDAMRLHQAMLSSATLDIGSINLVDMSPDEIKVSLPVRRLVWRLLLPRPAPAPPKPSQPRANQQHLLLDTLLAYRKNQAELKRVYAQLELLKNKAMRRDNPHILRRRGGRKSGHRKFSLQAFHPRHIGVGSLGKQAPQLPSQTGAAPHNEGAAGGAPRTLEELEEEEEEEEEGELERRSSRLLSGDILEEEVEEEVAAAAIAGGKAAEEDERAREKAERRRLYTSASHDPVMVRPLPVAATGASQAQAHNSVATLSKRPKPLNAAATAAGAGSIGASACSNGDAEQLMINDSQSSGNASPRDIGSSSFVCSQSSIHPE